MSWSIGGIIVAAVTYAYNQRDDQWAWRVPLALQWLFPVSALLQVLCPHVLTCLDPTHDSYLPRARITLVACSQGTESAGPSLSRTSREWERSACQPGTRGN